MVYDKERQEYSEQKVDKINLLKPYGIETSSGYGINLAMKLDLVKTKRRTMISFLV